jgi:hypothetical protein
MLFKNISKGVIILTLTVLIWSCKKLISIDEPKSQITSKKVFETDQSAVAAISNIYAQFSNGLSINGNLTLYTSLYVDELAGRALNTNSLEFYNSSVNTDNSSNLNIWKGFYSVIYQCNAVIEGLQNSKQVSAEVKNQLMGEAKFLRAYAYFYLINLYQDVPLLTTTDVYVNSSASRIEAAKVYELIISDLRQAKMLLKKTYPTQEKARANYWSAVALLARVYLFQSNWAAAEEESSSLIKSNTYPLTATSKVFTKSSNETILQAWTQDGFTLQAAVLNPPSGTPTYYLTPQLINSFESTDNRLASWIRIVSVGANSYPLSAKYKKTSTTTGPDEEYLVLLRSAEQYLIRAEARAQQSSIASAVADVNEIRSRAGLDEVNASISKDSCLTLIVQERRKEFFTEWSHRFFDLKRYNKINEVLSSMKPTWKSFASILPIPQNEVNINPNLTQNPGY